MSNDDIARRILDDVAYVVLATSDADGMPWATPVWFAQENYHDLYWVSALDTRHSVNVAERPQISMVVFDSTAAPLAGQAVYMSAVARQAPAEAIELFSRVAVRYGLDPWEPARVSGHARLRLFHAEVSEHWILDPDSAVETRILVHPER